MIVRDLEIDGFGVWTDLKLEGIDARLHVFYGPNEAGKTTLMEFVRAVLHGFSAERGERYLPPVYGGRGGGTIRVETVQGRYDIARHALGGESAGELSVVGPDGTRHGERTLQRLLQGVDERTFQNVFAVGLREIQELGTLSDSAAADLLYRLSTGFEGISLANVLRGVDTRRQQLLAADLRPAEIPRLTEERERLQQEIEKLREEGKLAGRLLDEGSKLDEQIVALENREAELRRLSNEIEAAISVHDTWLERQGLGERLERLGDVQPVPKSILDLLSNQLNRLGELRRAYAEQKKRRLQLVRDAKAVGVNQTLWRNGPRIDALADQQDWLVSLTKEIEAGEDALTGLENQLRRELERLGFLSDRTGKRKPLAEISLGAINSAARQVYDARKAYKNARGEATRGKAAVRADAASTAALVGGDPASAKSAEQELRQAIENQGKLVSDLRRRNQLDEKIEQLNRQEAEVNSRVQELSERQVVPLEQLLLLGGLFIVGVSLLLAGLLFPPAGDAGLWMTVIGFIGILGSVAGKVMWERSTQRQLEFTRRQGQVIAAQMRQLKDERGSIDARVPGGGGGPMTKRLHDAERTLAQLEEQLGGEGRRKAAVEQVGAAVDRARAAEESYRNAMRRWQQALVEAGLPSRLSPPGFRKYLQAFQEANQLEKQVGERREQLSTRRREWTQLCERIGRLVHECGFKPVSADPVEQLEQLRAELRKQEALVAKRDALREQARGTLRERQKLLDDRRHVQRQIGSLLKQQQVRSPAALRERAAQADEAAVLRGRFDTLTRLIDGTLGGRVEFGVVRRWLSEHDKPALETRLTENARELKQSETQLKALCERRGELRATLKTMSEDRTLAARQFELASVEAALLDAVERWQTLAITQRLMHTVRKRYEAERQPETLQEASSYLKRMTGGRYVRIWTPLDEDTLFVDDARGRTLRLETLSRGTREQLFLALRLALVAGFTRRGIRLPLVLDDVLVNFDGRRARLTIDMLRDFAAAGHQVLVFTCHRHVVEWFVAVGATAQRLPVREHEDDDFDWEPEPLPEPILVAAEPPAVEPLPPPPPVPAPPVAVVEPPPPPPPQMAVVAAPRPAQPLRVRKPATPRATLTELPRFHHRRSPLADASWQEIVEEDHVPAVVRSSARATIDPDVIADYGDADVDSSYSGPGGRGETGAAGSESARAGGAVRPMKPRSAAGRATGNGHEPPSR